MKTASILIVEDQRIVARDIGEQVTRLGYSVVGTTGSGEEAVRLAEERNPHLVLMDIRLEGGVNGVQAAQQIRERLQMPVVYLTAYADEETLGRAKVTEPFGYILKPFEERELRTVIEMALYKHQAERKLRESERRYAITLSSIGDAVIATDNRMRVTFMNPVAEALTGWPYAEAGGRPLGEVFRIIHEKTRQPVEDPATRVMREGTVVGLANHTVLLPRGGREMPIADCGAPIVDDRGEITGVVLVFHDVTQQRQAEEALRESQERLRLAVQASNLGPWDWDLRTNAVVFSPEWKRQIGYEPHEISGRYEEWESRLHPEDRERVLGELRAYLDGRQPEYVIEFRLRHKDGSYRWIYTRGIALRDADGKPSRMLGCHLDVTERKRLEDQFRQAQKMEAVGRLAGGVAHDFNNLLTIIIGYSEMVFSRLRRDDPSRELVAEVTKAGESAANLTRQLLAFSRKQVLQPQVVNLNTLLGELHKLLQRLIGEDIELALVPDAALGLAKVDPGQFEQAITNLAVNARDAMPRGGRLTIATQNAELDGGNADHHSEVRPGRYVLVAVTDTGHGMDEETKARIFEPFFTTKEPGKGTGLGLAMVYGFVKQSGGNVEVDSEVGRGTTFKVYLPRAEATTAPSKSFAGLPTVPKGTETILLVEDEDSVRTLSRLVLQSSGYTVLEARDGQEGVWIAQQHQGPIQLLVTDVVMPRMSGRQLADLLAQERPDMRILFLSGYTDEAVTHHGVLKADLAFLQKPFSPLGLARKVREVLDAKEAPR